MAASFDKIREIFARVLSRLGRDERGTFASTFAIMAVPATMVVAGAVDYNNVTRQRQEMQTAADAAVLGAARLGDSDAQRETIAQRLFDGQISENLRQQIISATFTKDVGSNTITAVVTADIKTFMPKSLMKDAFPITVKSIAAVAKPDVKQLDVVMCIDGTGSMSPTIQAVKNNALNFESNLNAELTRRGIISFNAMRVRVVFYRDFGGTNLTGSAFYNWVWNGSSWTYTVVQPSDPSYWTYVGDNPALKESGFFNLPTQRTDFSDFVNPETAWGGGDLPESGLECVNTAMTSSWAKPGDIVGGKPLESVYPLIVVWTDAAAHKPGYSVSLKNPSYPPSTVMPRTYADLGAKWNDSNLIDQNRKMLIFFGNPDLYSTDRDGVADGWKTIKNWPGFYLGGTLSDGNNNMVAKIADAISSKFRQPTLTH